MAQFEFKCPQCGQMVEADESFRGQTAECPFCGKGIVVPHGRPKSEHVNVSQKLFTYGNHDSSSSTVMNSRLAMNKKSDRSTIRTSTVATHASKSEIEILKKRLLALGVLGILILVCMVVLFGMKSTGRGRIRITKEFDGEKSDSNELSYSICEVNPLKCVIEKGIVNNFEDGFGFGLTMPYDLVAAVMPYEDFVARALSQALWKKIALEAAIRSGKVLAEGDAHFRTTAHISENGNVPSVGVAYKYRGYDWTQTFWFRVKAVYPQGVLVSLEYYTKESGWRHWAWAFVKTDRHYKVGDKLVDGYYILGGTAKCRLGTVNSTRYQQVDVRAFIEMDNDIAIKRGLYDKVK